MGDIRRGHWACRERISLGVGKKWLSKTIVLLFFSFLFLLAHSEREEREYFKKLKIIHFYYSREIRSYISSLLEMLETVFCA